MGTALYQLKDEYLQAAERMADLDLPDEVIQDTLSGLAGEIEVKCTNVAAFCKNLEASAAAIKEAESQMAARRKAIENRADRIRQYLLTNMLDTKITKIDSPWFKIAVRDNPPKVICDAIELVPEKFLRQPPPPPPEIDKKLVAAALKDGKVVSGCHLEQGKRLEIK